MDYKTIKHVNGYFQITNKPSASELENYYENKYYQEAQAAFELEYSEQELRHLKNRQRAIQFCLEKIFGALNDKSFLDVGCGEGWALDVFKSAGCNVKGVDFSSFGIEKFNPKLLGFFKKCDIYEFLHNEVKTANNYDIINLKNVIEHVLEPEDLLVELKTLLKPSGILVVTFPNDFSNYQKLLLELEKVDEQFWVSPPDHISYFTKDSFSNLAKSLGLSVEFILADFPIDIFLMNDHSNYVKNKSKGKQAHLARVSIMNFLYDQNLEQTVGALLKFGQLGFGRDLTVFLRIKK